MDLTVCGAYHSSLPLLWIQILLSDNTQGKSDNQHLPIGPGSYQLDIADKLDSLL